MDSKENSVKSPFTKREAQIASLLAEGLSEKEIADRLNISSATVNHHTQNIREKNGLSKNSEIILMYIAHVNKKPFSLKNIREKCIGIILIMLNICEISNEGIL